MQSVAVAASPNATTGSKTRRVPRVKGGRPDRGSPGRRFSEGGEQHEAALTNVGELRPAAYPAGCLPGPRAAAWQRVVHRQGSPAQDGPSASTILTARADQSPGHMPKRRWLYECSRVELAAPAAAGCTSGGCWCPVAAATAGWPSTLATAGQHLADWAGLGGRVCWRIVKGFQQSKNQAGLDHNQVRRWPGLLPTHHSGLLAHAFLVVTRTKAPLAPGQGECGVLTS
jgi:hypothetical protein